MHNSRPDGVLLETLDQKRALCCAIMAIVVAKAFLLLGVACRRVYAHTQRHVCVCVCVCVCVFAGKLGEMRARAPCKNKGSSSRHYDFAHAAATRMARDVLHGDRLR